VTADALLKKHGAITIVPTGRAGVPSIVELVTGGPIRGSWWAHPKGKEIFRVATELEESGRVLSAKLIDGKVTLLDRAHWPALYRVVTDEDWRRPRIASLSKDHRALLDEVEREDVVPTQAQTGARKALEERLLVRAASEHTDRGHHATTLSSWARWCPAGVASSARALTLAQAEEAMTRVLGGPLP